MSKVKKSYMSPSRDHGLKRLCPPNGPLKGFSSGIDMTRGIATLQVRHGGKPNPDHFKIHDQDYLTSIGGNDCKTWDLAYSMVQYHCSVITPLHHKGHLTHPNPQNNSPIEQPLKALNVYNHPYQRTYPLAHSLVTPIR